MAAYARTRLVTRGFSEEFALGTEVTARTGILHEGVYLFLFVLFFLDSPPLA
jgi:hypothetical protein